jgi:Nucleotide modification associated domain 3
MKGLLVRIGADQGEGGGWWNAPADSTTREFAYVPIPETSPIRRGFAKPYNLMLNAVQRFGVALPDRWAKSNMHLDPDFDYLTYGDIGEPGHRGAQIKDKLCRGDLLVFYGSFADVNPNPRLVYAIIGLYVIDSVIPAVSIPKSHWDENAHTRRVLARTALDIVVRAKPKVSGRLKTYVPIGEYRNRAYRVKRELLDAWGDLTVRDGFLQRSARLPAFRDAARLYEWFLSHNPPFLRKNN